MGSATATSVIWVGHESPLLEFGAERPARRHDHCRAPNRLAPCSPGMPLPSVEPATPPTDCGSPQTTAVASSWPRTRKANSRSKVRVGTTHRSTAAMASTWLRRNVRQLCEGGPRRWIMYFETVDLHEAVRRAARFPPGYRPGWMAARPESSGLQSRTVIVSRGFQEHRLTVQRRLFPLHSGPGASLLSCCAPKTVNCCHNRCNYRRCLLAVP